MLAEGFDMPETNEIRAPTTPLHFYQEAGCPETPHKPSTRGASIRMQPSTPLSFASDAQCPKTPTKPRAIKSRFSQASAVTRLRFEPEPFLSWFDVCLMLMTFLAMFYAFGQL